MTDQTAPDVTNDERRLARDWAEHIESNTAIWAGTARVRAAARVILNDVPAPAPPTLADIPRGERASCQWMQADTETWGRAVILLPEASSGLAVLLNQWGKVIYEDHARVTPRPDLPRLEWPGTEKPSPALPDGWRLADHQKHGRVIVTTQTPNREGDVYAVIPTENPLGYDWHLCALDELTFFDQGADQ